MLSQKCYTVVTIGLLECRGMEKRQLTMPEVLKFARHDFLNELQIILMHIDLGDTPQAKKAIMKTTEIMKHQSLLERLGLPETEKWIMTFEWMYTTFHKTLSCSIERGSRAVSDWEVVAYMERIIHSVEQVLDPMSDYEVRFDIMADQVDWSIVITVTGALPEKENASITEENFIVEEANSHNLWMFTIRGQ